MPILQMNQMGEIVEDNGQGTVKRATPVQDDNMLKLSIVEDRNILRDREALKKIQKKQAELAKMKWAQAVAHKAKQAQHKAETEEKLHLLNKKMKFLKEIKGNVKLAQALQQGNSNTFYEKMSGVTGYGLTHDGRVPQFSSANLDYNQIADANSDFGSFGFFGAVEIPSTIKPIPSILTQAEVSTFQVLGKDEVPLNETGFATYIINFKNELKKADSDPNYLGGCIDMAEYDAARIRGWGTTGFYYNEGRDNLWWPVKVVFHPHMIFFKRVPTLEGKAPHPRVMVGMRSYNMSLGKIYDRVGPLNKFSDFAYPREAPVAPAVQAVTVQQPLPTPVVAPVVPKVEQVVKQEQQIIKAIEQVEKKVEAEQKTVQAVAEITKPKPTVVMPDYRHPMLKYNLLKKVEAPAKAAPALSKSFTVFGVK